MSIQIATILILLLSIFSFVMSVHNVRMAYKKSNSRKKYLGWCSLVVSFVIIYNNFYYSEDPLTHAQFIPLLDMRFAFSFTLLSSLYCLYALSEVKPELSNKKLFTLLLNPSIMIGILIFSMDFLEVNQTPLRTWSDIAINISLADVKWRLLIIMISFVVSLAYALIPIIYEYTADHGTGRRFNRYAYIYISVWILSSLLFLPFSLHDSLPFEVLYRLSLLLFLNFIVLNIRFEKIHLTSSIFTAKKLDFDASNSHPCPDRSALCIVQKIKNEAYYLDPSVSAEDLSKKLQITKAEFQHAIKELGYNGYYEFINLMRIQHFKHEANIHPHKTLSDLYTQSGFNSKTSFYRIFQQTENSDPELFLKEIKQESSQSIRHNISEP